MGVACWLWLILPQCPVAASELWTRFSELGSLSRTTEEARLQIWCWARKPHLVEIKYTFESISVTRETPNQIATFWPFDCSSVSSVDNTTFLLTLKMIMLHLLFEVCSSLNLSKSQKVEVPPQVRDSKALENWAKKVLHTHWLDSIWLLWARAARHLQHFVYITVIYVEVCTWIVECSHNIEQWHFCFCCAATMWCKTHHSALQLPTPCFGLGSVWAVNCLAQWPQIRPENRHASSKGGPLSLVLRPRREQVRHGHCPCIWAHYQVTRMISSPERGKTFKCTRRRLGWFNLLFPPKKRMKKKKGDPWTSKQGRSGCFCSGRVNRERR